MEIEAKFSITSAQTYTDLMQVTHLGDYTLDAAQCTILHDTYMDTADHAAMRSYFALRQRVLNDTITMTLKSTLPNHGAVHRREEIEITLAEAVPLEALPESPFRSKVYELIGDATVGSICTIEQHRCVRQIFRDEMQIAEMALDQVTLHAGEREFPLLELEIELKGDGTEDDLAAMITSLSDFKGLVAQTHSKLERALALIPPTPPVTTPFDMPETPGIKPDDTMVEAARKTLRYHLGVMLANQAATYTGEDIEALHVMRVATRRMRAALRAFQQWIPIPIYMNVRKDLQRTGRALGEVRDLDVFRIHAETWQSDKGISDQALHTLSWTWNAAYSHARNAMIDHLESNRYQRFIVEFTGYLANTWEVPYTPTVAQAAPALIQARINAVRAYDSLASSTDAPLPHYHALRIEMKRLRYTLEFLREVLGDDVEAAITLMKSMQDHLGALQDAVVASAHLDSLLTWGTWSRPREPYTLWQPQLTDDAALSAYFAWRQAEIDTHIATFPDVWQQFANDEFTALIDRALHNLKISNK